MGRIELGGDARLEHPLMHGRRHTVAVIQDREAPDVSLPPNCKKDASCMGISGVAEHLYDDVFRRTDIMGRLTPFGFRYLEADKAISEIVFDSKMAIAAH